MCQVKPLRFSSSREVAEAGREACDSKLGACESAEGTSGFDDGIEGNALLPFALLSEDPFQNSPVSRLPVTSSEDPIRQVQVDKVLALPALPSVSGDLLAVMEMVEGAYQGEESRPLDSGRLSKGEVMDMLSEVENFMETQAIETAKLIGVAEDGVDKGLKSSMLLIKRRWLAGIARKAKADLGGRKDL